MFMLFQIHKEKIVARTYSDKEKYNNTQENSSRDYKILKKQIEDMFDDQEYEEMQEENSVIYETNTKKR